MIRINNITHFLYILLIYSIYCCRRSNEVLPTIDIEANIDKMKIMNLSEFTDEIRYITLETNEKLPLRNLNDVAFSKSNILIGADDLCLLFDTNGQLIRKIGNLGRGPGEYNVITNVGFSGFQKNKIFICSTYDVFEYDIIGRFINKYSKIFSVNDLNLLQDCSVIRDSLFIGYIRSRKGNSEYKAMIINKFGKVIATYKDYERTGGFAGRPSTYQFKNSVCFKQQFNDTLFSVSEEYQIIPKYVFKLGNLKLPINIRLRFPMGEVVRNYLFISNVFETDNYLIINCDLGNRFPARRLTPKPSIFPGGGYASINTSYVVGMHNKKTKALNFIKPSDTDNPLYTTGFYNDIDCGPRFYPLAMVSDNTLVTWIKPYELKAHVASDEFKNNKPKYPLKKKELKELADRLTEFDNPVLMVVQFKK